MLTKDELVELADTGNVFAQNLLVALDTETNGNIPQELDKLYSQESSQNGDMYRLIEEELCNRVESAFLRASDLDTDVELTYAVTDGLDMLLRDLYTSSKTTSDYYDIIVTGVLNRGVAESLPRFLSQPVIADAENKIYARDEDNVNLKIDFTIHARFTVLEPSGDLHVVCEINDCSSRAKVGKLTFARNGDIDGKVGDMQNLVEKIHYHAIDVEDAKKMTGLFANKRVQNEFRRATTPPVMREDFVIPRNLTKRLGYLRAILRRYFD